MDKVRKTERGLFKEETVGYILSEALTQVQDLQASQVSNLCRNIGKHVTNCDNQRRRAAVRDFDTIE